MSLETLRKAFPQYKFDKLDILGEGESGTAYDIGNGVVLKITDSFSEAKASANVKGKKLKYVNEIYDVFKVFKEWREIRLEKGYYIFQKKLDHISKEERDVLDWLIYAIEWGVGSDKPTIKKFKDFVKDGDLKVIDEILLDLGSKLENYSKNRKFIAKIFKKYIDFWLTTKEELGSCGVRFSDYHTNNIMQGENGEYVLIDLGFSKAPKIDIENRMVESFKDYFNTRLKWKNY